MSIAGSGLGLVGWFVGCWHFFDHLRVRWLVSFNQFIFLPKEIKSII